GIIQLQRGKAEEARSQFARFNKLEGLGEWFRVLTDAMVEHTAGDAPASKRATDEFEKKFGAGDPFSSAQLRAWRGETDAAFAWLDKALAAHDPLLAQIKTDVYMGSLHADPRWNALLARIGLPPDPATPTP